MGCVYSLKGEVDDELSLRRGGGFTTIKSKFGFCRDFCCFILFFWEGLLLFVLRSKTPTLYPKAFV